MQYFFMPETRYVRHVKLPAMQNIIPEGQEIDEKGGSKQTEMLNDAEVLDSGPAPIPAKKTFWQDLAIFHGIFPSKNSIPFLIAQPFLLLFTPGLLYGGIVYGLGITWLVLIATAFAVLCERKLAFANMLIY